MLEATVHRWRDAEEHFEAALALEHRVNSAPFIAHTKYWYADCLAQQGEPHHQRPIQLLTEAMTTATTLGMSDLAHRGRERLASLNTPRPTHQSRRTEPPEQGPAAPACTVRKRKRLSTR